MNYTSIDPEFTKRFFALVKDAQSIIVTGHMMPDGDSIGSVLAVYAIIMQKFPGTKIRMVYGGEDPGKYQKFQNFEKVEWVADVADVVTPDDTLIVVDGSQFYRFSHRPDALRRVSTTICIDHHASPVDEFTLSLVMGNMPANGEVIYRAFKDEIAVDKPLAEIFLLAILSDTGCLAYLQPSQYGTLDVAKVLLEIGHIDIPEFQARYRTLSERQFVIFQELIKNARLVRVEGWPPLQYSFLSEAFVSAGGYSDSDISEASWPYADEYLYRIADHPWGFVVRPHQQDNVRISMRSLTGSVNVRDVMERLGFGGGHDRSAGGTCKTGSSEECAQAILQWLSNNRPVLS